MSVNIKPGFSSIWVFVDKDEHAIGGYDFLCPVDETEVPGCIPNDPAIVGVFPAPEDMATKIRSLRRFFKERREQP